MNNERSRLASAVSDEEESFSSATRFYDAVGDSIFNSPPSGRAADAQPSVLGGADGNARNAPASGVKPPWGWDYAMSFKIPTFLKHRIKKLNERRALDGTPGPQSDMPPDDDSSDRSREQTMADRDNEIVQTRVDILAKLSAAGFVFSQLLIPSEDIILVRLSLPEDVMKRKAVSVGIELPLKTEYGGGYLAYSSDREELFANNDDQKARNAYFGPADRSIIILKVLQSKESWGCDLNIERLLLKKVVLQAFAIHSVLEQKRLIHEAVWKRMWDPTWVPPFKDVKDYVGARVAFYFVFVNFYARRLLCIALVSIPVYVVYRVLRNERAIATVYWVFSIGLVLWTTVFLECWKRRNAEINLEWGLEDYHDDSADDTRVQFVGDLRYGFYCAGGFVSLEELVDEVSQDNEKGAQLEEGRNALALKVSDIPRNPYHDPKKSRNNLLVSTAVTSFFVVLVGGLTFLLLWFRNDVIDYFEGRISQKGFARAIPGILNGLLVTVFDAAWRPVSLVLTRRENHRTNQKFENSLVYKRFAFQFVSNYISLFFIAFVRPFLNNTCRPGYLSDKPDCMVELENQLMSLLITKATIGQIMEVGVPFFTARIKQWRARSRSSAVADSPTDNARGTPDPYNETSAHTRYVAESKLANYDSTMEDYGELVLQFGYVVLFGLAFPPAAVVALINNVIEGRTDAYKILALSQRVSADDAADIGAWYLILEFLNVLSAATNAGLVVFTADAAGVLFGFGTPMVEDSWQYILYRVVAFFLMEHLLLGVKGGAAVVIADVPGKVKRAAARRGYDIARVVGEGWRDAWRGGGALVVQERQKEVCARYAEVFEVASDDGNDRMQ